MLIHVSRRGPSYLDFTKDLKSYFCLRSIAYTLFNWVNRSTGKILSPGRSHAITLTIVDVGQYEKKEPISTNFESNYTLS